MLASQAGRWTLAQRDQVRDLLSAQVGDPGIPAARRAKAPVSVSRIPGSGDRVLSWAASEEATVAEAALGCLGHAGRSDDVLRVLLTWLGDTSRAAAAAPHGLRRAGAAFSSGGPAWGAVSRSPSASRRHGCSGGTAPPARSACCSAPGPTQDCTRDTRIAVETAIRTLFDGPRALPALREAAGAHASEPMLRALFQAQPQECRPADRPAYAALVKGLLLAADGPGVRFRGSRAFATWARWYEGDLGSLLESAVDPRNPVGQESVQILVTLLRDGLGTAEGSLWWSA